MNVNISVNCDFLPRPSHSNTYFTNPCIYSSCVHTICPRSGRQSVCWPLQIMIWQGTDPEKRDGHRGREETCSDTVKSLMGIEIWTVTMSVVMNPPCVLCMTIITHRVAKLLWTSVTGLNEADPWTHNKCGGKLNRFFSKDAQGHGEWRRNGISRAGYGVPREYAVAVGQQKGREDSNGDSRTRGERLKECAEVFWKVSREIRSFPWCPLYFTLGWFLFSLLLGKMEFLDMPRKSRASRCLSPRDFWVGS